ncbi:MAG TPA: hypothetical protein VFV99_12230 [Kofleriaceae bacterium]|nr:hypothetical protein [Kofleriaceae bacterium]
MGTLSKRPLRDFSDDVKDRIENVRTSVGSKLESMRGRAEDASRHEGAVTKAIEKLTAALPSTTWLLFAGASLIGAIAFRAARRNHASLFIGQWVPTFLILGLYNKLVKVEGSERASG